MYDSRDAATVYWLEWHQNRSRLGTLNYTLNSDAIILDQGIARTQSPTNKNDAFELPTFGVIVGVSRTEVQWSGLALEEPPS